MFHRATGEESHRETGDLTQDGIAQLHLVSKGPVAREKRAVKRQRESGATQSWGALIGACASRPYLDGGLGDP